MKQNAPTSAPTLEQLYRRHVAFVRRVASHLGGRELDSDDVAQEVFLVAARRLASFDHARVKPTTWLYGITLNEVRRLRRNQRRRLALHSQEYDGVSFAHEPIDRVEVSQAARIAREVLSSIGNKKAEAFVLAEIHGYDCESIAELVGVKTETVWSRLHYARREFAQRLHSRRDHLHA
jgi:RNA polymerase sigma-70 factor (ECF subfamily)